MWQWRAKQLAVALIAIFAVSAAGATLVEYGVALIVAIVVGTAAINLLATAVSSEISDTASAF